MIFHDEVDSVHCLYMCAKEWFQCIMYPLSLMLFFRFCYLLGCGCVFAERALNELKDGSCVEVCSQFV